MVLVGSSVFGGNVKLLLNISDPHAPRLGDDAHQTLAGVAHLVVLIQAADALLDDSSGGAEKGVFFTFGGGFGAGAGSRTRTRTGLTRKHLGHGGEGREVAE
ncbi:hypothetical protein MPH_06620 [Macrophomina phaseolina MS6]|uniref:Uncharacterized protein n=1 Tax=Macrophomina phaseolina (strain MS6) TaxID=1126212 RepID=K2RNB3_MACPH|nr:hypothetical protein MPH_06620 [Macrophomina phaseolina MS6]